MFDNLIKSVGLKYLSILLGVWLSVNIGFWWGFGKASGLDVAAMSLSFQSSLLSLSYLSTLLGNAFFIYVMVSPQLQKTIGANGESIDLEGTYSDYPRSLKWFGTLFGFLVLASLINMIWNEEWVRLSMVAFGGAVGLLPAWSDRKLRLVDKFLYPFIALSIIFIYSLYFGKYHFSSSDTTSDEVIMTSGKTYLGPIIYDDGEWLYLISETNKTIALQKSSIQAIIDYTENTRD
jgi:hypothetical protein